ncbi:hypothetical protein Vretifemale_3944 [Volvox reticuliferus]|nr:hypothetical protein Vretifemale_3944 [Volvox reticuliferus]
MAERQPTICLCFLRKRRKDFVGNGACKGAPDAEEECNRDAGNPKPTGPVDAAGIQQGSCPPGRDEAGPPAEPAASAPSLLHECVTILPNNFHPALPKASAVVYPAAPLPDATDDFLRRTQPPVYTGTAGALDASDAITAINEVPRDTCTLSTTSHVSTAYFSAGGWSQFGEDGEWLGGGPPSALITRSMDYAASTAGLPSPDLNGDTHDPHASDTAQPSGPQPTDRQEPQPKHHLLPRESQQKHQHTHGLPALDERGQIQRVHPSPDQHAMTHMHTANTTAPELGCEPQSKSLPLLEGLPAVPRPPTELPLRPLIVAVQEAADTLTGTHKSDIPLAVPERREQEQYNGQGTQSLPQHQHQHQHQTLAPGGLRCNSDGSDAAITAAAAAITGPGVTANSSGATEQRERDDALDKVVELYTQQGRPCMACQVLLQYCKANNVSPESLQQKLHALQMPNTESLTMVAQWVTDCMADIANDDGWQLVRNDELQLLYRHLPGQTVHAFRARCIVEAPIEHLLSLAREVDLCPTWNKYCTSATILREISVTDVLVYVSVWMPWPFNDVGFMLEAVGADLFDEEGRLVICFKTPDRKAPVRPQ